MSLVFFDVFRRVRYIALSCFAALFFFLFAVWLPNIALLRVFITSASFSFSGLFALLIESFSIFVSTNNSIAVFFVVINATLFGITLGLSVALFMRQRLLLSHSGTLTVSAVFSSMLGLGCASCGSVLLSFFGVGATLAFLPFGGIELQVLSVVLLAVAFVTILRRLARFSCH